MKRESFNRIYEEYHRLVIHVAFDILRDYDLAQDVCQEVFFKFYEKIEVLDEDKIKGWMLRNAQRKTIDFLRKAYRKREIPVVEEKIEQELVSEYLVETETESCRKEFRNFVLEELKERNPMWYDLMMRVVMGRESVESVAEEYGITVMNLRVRISRARHWLYKNYYRYYQEL
ncbi:MAG: sigma-70 family RNA polymerase sigma factor [Lachnospiraceae bacterium]|nr:sigma-70 family RNA polymerase sigma factor [Lachnospiraceae bacterium]